MTDRLDQVETLQRLRIRDADRQARAVAEAVAASDLAAAGLADAERRERDASRALDRARGNRVRHPGDDCVRSFVEACEAGVADAQSWLAKAREALDQAREQVSAARRKWLRAQGRCQALDRLLHQIRMKRRRSVDRRAADEANDCAATNQRMMMA